jgi:hypothetical protein
MKRQTIETVNFIVNFPMFYRGFALYKAYLEVWLYMKFSFYGESFWAA